MAISETSRSMVDIQSVAAEIRRGIKKKKIKEDRRKKLQGKNIMAPLLHRAAIISLYDEIVESHMQNTIEIGSIVTFVEHCRCIGP